jgi:hypothetical protein
VQYLSSSKHITLRSFSSFLWTIGCKEKIRKKIEKEKDLLFNSALIPSPTFQNLLFSLPVFTALFQHLERVFYLVSVNSFVS